MKLYDEDGCYCLLIAILTGLDASKSRMVYQHGPDYPACRKFMEGQRLSEEKTGETKTERMKAMRALREKGCSIEMLAAIFDCDCSTVRRNLKKGLVQTNDEI